MCPITAIDQAEVVVTKDPVSTCKDCPLSGKYAGREAMTIRLQIMESLRVIMCVYARWGHGRMKKKLIYLRKLPMTSLLP